MSIWNQLMLQDGITPIMEEMIMFHDHAMMVIMMIIMMIMYMLLFMFKNNYINRYMMEGQLIEIIWTIIPMFFLIILAIPSLKILYMIDEMNFPKMSIKIIGHQWYWSYEYNDFKSIMFDSFMLKNNLNFRLLEVDNRLIIPYNLQIRFLVSSMDVIHSFTVPSMGIKIDAIPGRINQISFNMKYPGIFFGQCSEICGINHSFMPIMLESTSINNFINWIKIY
nr:cytochrome c oxidase subunit II [Pachycrepoideus vindemmiae]